MNVGSSPLTRGTQGVKKLNRLSTRFIPAYAGNSLRQTILKKVKAGSSPLTRGTRKVGPDELIRLRFIPAYAGNSAKSARLPARRPVHPRLRGELADSDALAISMSGSSPLTRGTPRTNTPAVSLVRFIPAYAGNSLKDGINPSIHTLGI